MPTITPSDAFVDALRFGATLVQAQMTLYQNGLPLIEEVPVSTLQVTVDRNSAQRRQGTFTIELLPTIPPPPLMPTVPGVGPGSYLTPFGNELFLQVGIGSPSTYLQADAPAGAQWIVVESVINMDVGTALIVGNANQVVVQSISGSNSPYIVTLQSALQTAQPLNAVVQVIPQWVPMGMFEIATTTVDDSGIDLVVNLEVYDRSWVLSQRAFVQPYNFPATASGNFVDEIQTLVTYVWGTNQRTGTAIPNAPALNVSGIVPTTATVPVASYDQGSDPWQAAQDMAAAVGYELFFDVYGNLVGVPIPNPTTQPISWNFTDDSSQVFGTGGVGGGGGSTVLQGSPYSTPTDTKNQFTRDGIYNDVYITGTGTSNAPASTTGSDAPVLAEAADVNPQSPTYYEGPMGDVPEFVSSNLTTTSGQAGTAAISDLLLALSAAWQITVTLAPNPMFDIDDVVTVTRARMGLNMVPMIIDSISYTISFADTCSITGRVASPSYYLSPTSRYQLV